MLCLHYLANTVSLHKVKQVSWKAGKSKLSFGRCFFLNCFSKELSLYLKAAFCWLLYDPCMLLVVVLSASWLQEQEGASQGTEEGPRRWQRADTHPSGDWNCRRRGGLRESGITFLEAHSVVLTFHFQGVICYFKY